MPQQQDPAGGYVPHEERDISRIVSDISYCFCTTSTSLWVWRDFVFTRYGICRDSAFTFYSS